jgi:hypothetical protein
MFRKEPSCNEALVENKIAMPWKGTLRRAFASGKRRLPGQNRIATARRQPTLSTIL